MKFSFLIRLDDACETMDLKKWERMESILDKYGVVPIVGVIPECKDESAYFLNPYIENYWDIVKRWQSKGWAIAQHGLNHLLNDIPKGVKTAQKNVETFTEFAGLTYEEQLEKLQRGYQILQKNGVVPTCFFAPAHTFDSNTIKACKHLGFFDFISDGYAFGPFYKDEMLFVPAAFDTPKKMPFGIFTFVFHPNRMDDDGFNYLCSFLEKNSQYAITPKQAISEISLSKRQGLSGKLSEFVLYYIRRIRNREIS